MCYYNILCHCVSLVYIFFMIVDMYSFSDSS